MYTNSPKAINKSTALSDEQCQKSESEQVMINELLWTIWDDSNL